MILATLRLLHLLGMVAFLGGAFAQQQLLRASASEGLAPQVRDAYERLAAAIVTKIELPGIFAQVAIGVLLIVRGNELMHQHWLHGKLAAVAIILVLSHLEMFNARRIVRARAERGDAAAAELDLRKRRHGIFGAVGTVLVVAVLLFATVLRGVL